MFWRQNLFPHPVCISVHLKDMICNHFSGTIGYVIVNKNQKSSQGTRLSIVLDNFFLGAYRIDPRKPQYLDRKGLHGGQEVQLTVLSDENLGPGEQSLLH